jgi:uncharacterized protein (TIGR02588 family)
MKSEQEPQNPAQRTTLQKNGLEWSVFALSLMLVIGTLGYLTWAALMQSDEPAQLEVRLGEPQQRKEQFAVPVSVLNDGDRTAEGVVVEVSLENDSGQEVETSQFEIAFVPRHSTREGEVLFKQNPQIAANVTARVLGYETP